MKQRLENPLTKAETAPQPSAWGFDGPSFDFNEKIVRKAFISKVFMIVSLQVLVTGLVSWIMFGLEDCLDEPAPGCEPNFFVQPVTLFVSCIFSMVIIFMLICCMDVLRKAPANYIILGVFTLFEAHIVGWITTNYEADVVFTSLFILAGILVSVIAIVQIFNFDFTKYLEIAFTLLICLILVSIVLAVFSITGVLSWGFGRTAISTFGIMLFCLFLLIDIQLVMGGGKYEFSPEDYIIAALNIYLDIINLFLYLLEFLDK